MSLTQISWRVVWSLTPSPWRAEASARRRFSGVQTRSGRPPLAESRAPHSVPSPISGRNSLQLADPSCNSQLQLATFPRSVDYRGLNWNLSPFRINTSKKLCIFHISFISGHLKSSIINTSMKNASKSSIINTSKKHGGGVGAQLQLQLQLATGRRARSARDEGALAGAGGGVDGLD
jgi:hypothetical protein